VIEDYQGLLDVVENYQMLNIKRIANVIVGCLAINFKFFYKFKKL
jgi:hypothetical protein